MSAVRTDPKSLCAVLAPARGETERYLPNAPSSGGGARARSGRGLVQLRQAATRMPGTPGAYQYFALPDRSAIPFHLTENKRHIAVEGTMDFPAACHGCAFLASHSTESIFVVAPSAAKVAACCANRCIHLAGIDYVHEMGVSQRDIKLENTLVVNPGKYFSTHIRILYL